MNLAADTSTWIAYFEGASGADVQKLAASLQEGRLMMPPVVLLEILSEPKSTDAVESLILSIPTLECPDGFWGRAALLRRLLLKRGFKAKISDTLIAQSCIDHDAALITRDKDFRHFEKYGKLRLDK